MRKEKQKKIETKSNFPENEKVRIHLQPITIKNMTNSSITFFRHLDIINKEPLIPSPSVEYFWIWKGTSPYFSTFIEFLFYFRFCHNFYILSFFFIFLKKIFILRKISFLLNFPFFFFSTIFIPYFHFGNTILLMLFGFEILLGMFAAIRLVKRRVEKHQQHSITHTSFTEKYVSINDFWMGYKMGGWNTLAAFDKLFPQS